MKKLPALVSLFVIVFVFPSLALHAQNSFEGTLTWTMTMPGIPDTIYVFINVKGLKTEMDEDMGSLGSSKMWADRATGKFYVAMSSVKNGTVQDMGEMTPPTSTSLDIEPTGRTETIAGYTAKEYLNETPKGDASMWVTSGLPKDVQYSIYNWAGNTPNRDANQLKVMKEFIDRGLAPVRIGLTIDGKPAMTMQFVKFERKHLPDALFIPPADVKFDAVPPAAQSGTH